MARKQHTEQWAEHRRQRDQEERRQRVMVITEFDAGDPEATLHAAWSAVASAPAAIAAALRQRAGAPFVIGTMLFALELGWPKALLLSAALTVFGYLAAGLLYPLWFGKD